MFRSEFSSRHGLVDPVTFEVVKSALDSIADEAAIALYRSAYSAIVRDSLDYSTAVFDEHGRMLAQGLTTAMHIGSFPDPMALVAKRQDTVEGDLYVLNDPYSSAGMHLPDFYAIKPVFVDSILVGYVTTLTHLADVGGLTPGSTPIHSTEIFQEGLRVPLLKLYSGGRPNEEVFAILAQNTRLPLKVLGDVRAQIAGCTVAERSFRRLVRRYGLDTLRACFTELIDYSERAMREVISELPDGRYEFTDYIDGLGEEPEEIVFQVAVVIDGDELTVDWTGTSAQVKGGINQAWPVTKAATYLGARLLVPYDIPNTEGYLRPLKTIAPLGTIVRPVEPAPVATYGITACRSLDAIFGALAQAVPGRMPACGEGGNYWPTIGGYHDGRAFVYVESVMGCWGGRPTMDGTEGVPHPSGNQPNQPIEMVEARQPLQVTRYELIPDSAGAGKFRGGLALRREYKLLAQEAVAIVRTDKRSHPPYGLWGGMPGAPSATVLRSQDGEARLLPTLPMEPVILRRGDLLEIALAGGGGWGNPLERSPELVVDDVREGKLSVDCARESYGVVCSDAGWDEEASQKLRQEHALADRAAEQSTDQAVTASETSSDPLGT
jgi:N-methylhydantoinase B